MTMLLALAALLAPQADPLAPLAFLAGHCWRAEEDEMGFENWHCFERTADGGIHGVQEARKPGQRIKVSETDYRWDPAAHVIRYRVADSETGGRRVLFEGTVTVNGNVFDMGTIRPNNRVVGWSLVRVENGYDSRIDLLEGKGPVVTNRLRLAD